MKQFCDETLPRASRPIVLNQSGLKNYNNCQRLWGWREIAGLEPVGRRSAPEIGTAVHEGLAVFHMPGGTPDAALKAMRAKLKERSGIQSRFEDKNLDESMGIAERTLKAYFAHWTEANNVWTPLEQEVEFTVEVGTNTNVFLRGRMDNLSVIPGSGLYIVDYKTAGKMDPRDLLKYEMDIQITAYLYGLTKHLTEEAEREGTEPPPIKGAIIDLLVKTKEPQFARELFTRTDDEFADFEWEFVTYGVRIREALDAVDSGIPWKRVFLKHTEHCFRYGTCAFRDLCVKDTPERRMLYNPKSDNYVDEAQKKLDAEWAAREARGEE